MNRVTRNSASRRTFMKRAGAAALASVPICRDTAFALPRTSTSPDSSAPSAIIKNLAPLAPNAFYTLPLGAIRPSGWLREQLQIQANGLGGHLDETWADVGSNSGWLGGTGESWERGPYFLDGLIPLAYLLDDARLKAKAQKFVDWTLTNQASTGMIGPRSNDDWWPRMVMLKALVQYQEATGDPRVIPVLLRYSAYQLKALPGRPLRDWGRFRWQDNALVGIWLYNRTGDANVLELVRLLHKQGYDWQAQFSDFKYTQPITPEIIKLNNGGGLSEIMARPLKPLPCGPSFQTTKQTDALCTNFLLHSTNITVYLTECSPATSTSLDPIHRKGPNSALWSRPCFRSSSPWPFSAMPHSAIDWSE